MLEIQKCIECAIQQEKHRNRANRMKHFQQGINEKGYFTMREEDQFLPQEKIKIRMHPQDAIGFRLDGAHNHDFFELIYVYSGCFMNQIEGETITQTEQQVVLLNLGTRHNTWITSKQDIVFNILLRKSTVEQTFLHLLQSNQLFLNFFMDSLYQTNQPNYSLQFVMTPSLSHILQTIVSEYYEQKEFYQEVLVAHLLQLFFELARIYSNSKEEQSIPDHNHLKINHILEYMQRNYSHTSLQETAEQFHYSPRHLSRLVREQTGKTFSEWIHQYKLQTACDYLKNSCLTIQQIAEITGYQDCGYFRKAFKKQYGITVTQFRKEKAI